MSEAKNKSELEKVEEVWEESKQGKISIENFKEIIAGVSPETLSQFLDTFKSISSDAKEVQIEAVKSISSVDFDKYVEPLKTILERKDLSDEVLLHIVNELAKLATLEAEAKENENGTKQKLHEGFKEIMQTTIKVAGSVILLAGSAAAAWLTFKDDEIKPK